MSATLALLLACPGKGEGWRRQDSEPPPDPGEWSCFPAGVQVWTPDGQRPIEELEPGDGIYGLVEGAPRRGRVDAVHRRRHETLLVLHTDQGELRLTPEHPVWSVPRQSWRRAELLAPGEQLRGLNGAATLLAVERLEGLDLEVFDLTVEGAGHTFFAEGLLVHNKSYAYGDTDGGGGYPDGRPDPPDADGDGHVYPEDCKPLDATVHPGAQELCDSLDNDCDSQIDEGEGGYADRDGDGHGDPERLHTVCEEPSVARVESGTDCDDEDASVYPGAAETCDEVDSDCDGDLNDENSLGCTTYLLDADDDGFASRAALTACFCEPTSTYGAEHEGWDCDDSDATVYPGAEELCDGLDNDCDGRVDTGC